MLQIANTKAKLKQIQSEQEQHLTHKIDLYKTKEDLNKASKSYTTISKSIEQADKDLNSKRELLSKEQKKKERYQIALEKIKKEIDKRTNAIEVLNSQISNAFLNQHKHLASNLLTEKRLELEQTITKITGDYERISKQIEETKNTVSVLKTKTETNQKHLNQEIIRIEELNKQLETEIEKSDFDNYLTVKNTLQLKLDISSAKNKIQSYYQQSEVVSNEISKLKKGLQQQIYDASKHQEAIAQLKITKEKLSQTHLEQGKTQTMIQDLTSKIALSKELPVNLKNYISELPT